MRPPAAVGSAERHVLLRWCVPGALFLALAAVTACGTSAPVRTVTLLAGPALGVVVEQDLRVVEVEPGSAAAQAGIRPGDVLIGLDGVKPSTAADAKEAYRRAAKARDPRQCGGDSDVVARTRPGDQVAPSVATPPACPPTAGQPVSVTLQRGGRTLTINVPVEPRSARPGAPTPTPVPATQDFF